jgi:hypothetical protein
VFLRLRIGSFQALLTSIRNAVSVGTDANAPNALV